MMQRMDFYTPQVERLTAAEYTRRVQSIAGTDGWTATADLQLMENHWRGIPIGAVAAMLTVTQQQAVERRAAIVAVVTDGRDVPLEHRGLVLDELRAAVERGQQ